MCKIRAMDKILVPCVFLLTGFLSTAISAQSPQQIRETYREKADKIIEAALSDEGVWSKLEYLCDRIGHRLSGSASLERAVEWAAGEMKKDGLQNVTTPPVRVTHWVRGKEWGRVVSPVKRSLHLLGLGRSIATPPEGIRAEVVVVESFDELEALGHQSVMGKIVVYNVPFVSYGTTVRYRSSGASRAAALGAVACLLRSVTPLSLQSPHTGAMRYSEGIPKIPSAAITIEDATMLSRLARNGEPLEVELYMEARTLPDALSANVIGEIVGRELPQEVVVIGGHIDSWDVGQGAHDDGGGIVVAMQTAKLLLDLEFLPKRTLRVVLWTNEENGLAGGRAYRDWIGQELENHVAAIEMDEGAEKPVGFGMSIRNRNLTNEEMNKVFARVQAIVDLLEPIGANRLNRGGGGADISPLMSEGVPGLGLVTVGTHYFDWHHTHSDTLDKVDKEDLKKNLAAMAIVAFIIADLPDPLVFHDK
jgi:carboxypeptidase Q